MRNVLLSAIFVTLTPVVVFAQSHQDWTYNLGMYEVNIRQYTEEGTFSAFAEHLDRLEEMGVGILWLMPIHPIGLENRLGSLGSYYSVRDYKDINPEFGTLEDFEDLVREIHERGMYVMLDWVPNHTSWDNYLTEEHPEWYITEGGEFIPPPGTGWSDVIQLDHSNPDLLDYMIDAMLFWVEEYNVDGFRYDAVSHVLEDDFLDDLNQALKDARPDIFLLAEHHEPKWHDLGFDMSFGWGLYGFGHGVLRRIADGDDDAGDLHNYMQDEINRFPPEAYRMYFTSNHDENSWVGTTAELFGDAAEVFAVLTHTISGMPLIYSGQEAGLDERLAFFEKDQINWQEHPKKDMYTSLLQLKRENQALWNGDLGGQPQRVGTSNDQDVYAFTRSVDEDQVFVMYNLSDSEQTVTLESNDGYSGQYREIFTGSVSNYHGQETVTLPAWGYRVYERLGDPTSSMTDELPERYSLHQNYPNPFNPATTIAYELPEAVHVEIAVFDMLGRRAATLVNNRQEPGAHTVNFDASGLSSGTYLIRMQAGQHTFTRKMMLLK
ncbi:alpha-amylase family glycosyl hydrolase [Balneolales bacterium ANBcel1]|nr:alpha-amylase family glycosyl hydrolase [Balneolales bacterium ANBcel1]